MICESCLLGEHDECEHPDILCACDCVIDEEFIASCRRDVLKAMMKSKDLDEFYAPGINHIGSV